MADGVRPNTAPDFTARTDQCPSPFMVWITYLIDNENCEFTYCTETGWPKGEASWMLIKNGQLYFKHTFKCDYNSWDSPNTKIVILKAFKQYLDKRIEAILLDVEDAKDT